MIRQSISNDGDKLLMSWLDAPHDSHNRLIREAHAGFRASQRDANFLITGEKTNSFSS